MAFALSLSLVSVVYVSILNSNGARPRRYGLSPLVLKGEVTSVTVLPPSESHRFQVTIAEGRRFRAQRVVCAMGPGPAFKGMRATLPWWADDLRAELAHAGRIDMMLHSQQLVPWLQEGGDAKLRGRRVLVVGGGQTAAHLALLAGKAGCSRVVLASRRR